MKNTMRYWSFPLLGLLACTLTLHIDTSGRNKKDPFLFKNSKTLLAAVKPIALVYQVNKETEPVGGWILDQTNKSLKMRVFQNNHEWEFIGHADGRIDLKIGGDNFLIRKLVIANASLVSKPTAGLLTKNGYVSVLAEGNIPTPAKIITPYTDGRNRGGSFTVQLPFSDGSKIIELSWNAFNGKWGCTKSGSGYIPVGKTINAVYVYDEMNSQEILTNYTPPAISSTTNHNPATYPERKGSPSMAKIVFGDTKEYYANVISKEASQIEISIIPGGDIYTISNKGIILSGGGYYAKGKKVQSITVKEGGRSIYDKIDQANFSYGTLGIEFPDGQIQYGSAVTIGTTFLSLIMAHSGFNYQLYYKNGEWKIDNAGGEYRNGTILRDIFELASSFKKFY